MKELQEIKMMGVVATIANKSPWIRSGIAAGVRCFFCDRYKKDVEEGFKKGHYPGCVWQLARDLVSGEEVDHE